MFKKGLITDNSAATILIRLMAGIVFLLLVAFATTKIKVLADDGFREMMHGSRTDRAMLLGAIFLLIKGGGRWSIDQKLHV